jgi:hypothetical protein
MRRDPVCRLCTPARRCALLILAAVLAATQPAYARIIRTRPSASSNYSPWAPFTIGSGLELQTDSEETELDLPFLLEYSFSELLKVTIEPSAARIVSRSADVRSAGGLGDLETSMEYEFVRERRYRPALTAEALVKWPTASTSDLGEAGRDYSLGLVMSKDLVYVGLDLNALYTVVGDPALQDVFESSVACEYPLSRSIDLEAELLHAFGAGGVRGEPGTIGGLGGVSDTGTEGTLGIGEYLGKYLKTEQGVVVQSDGTWQVAFAWEWSFGGRD